MAAVQQDFTMWAGNKVTFQVTVTDEDGAAVNISGFAISWVLRMYALATEDLVVKTVGAGVTLTNPTQGVFTVALDSEDTIDLAGNYYHEAARTDAGSETTYLTGTVTINPTIVF